MSKVWTSKKGTQFPLRDIKGQSYLDVKWRIVAFRESHPDWTIETEFISITDKSACARAVIKDEQGRTRVTAHKHEDIQGFFDYREKAETGAIGRALALIGFGTQFAPELEEGHRIVDSPVQIEKPLPFETKASLKTDGEIKDEYRIPFGKFKGKAIEEVPLEELFQSVQYWERKAQKENKPLDGKPKEFVERVLPYLKARH